jgi:hypothetical protein
LEGHNSQTAVKKKNMKRALWLLVILQVAVIIIVMLL